MRAWFLILVVLATFKPTVQVASTEDLPTTFSTAISTRSVTSLAAFYEPVFQVPRVSFAQTTILYYSDKSESDIYKTTHNDKKSISVTATTENAVNEEQRPVKKVDLSVKKSNQLEKLKQENTYKLFDEVEKNYKFSKMIVAKHTKSSGPSSKPASKVIGDAPSLSRSLEVEALEIAPLREASPAAAMLNAEQQRPNSFTGFVASEDTSQSGLPATSSLESSHNRLVKEGAGVEDHYTYSNKEVIGEKIKPDPSTLVEIENSLLSLFNMKRPPKIDRSKIVIPEVMKQLYSQIMGHDIDSVNIPKPGILTKSANTVRSFTHQDSKIDDRFLHHHRFRVHFDVRSIPIDEKLKAAELHLWRDAISHAVLHPRLANRTRYQVLVYDITRVGIRGKREPTYLLLDNKTIRLNSTDTVSLDVQPAVDRWLETPKKNYGLLIEVRTFRALKPAPHHHVRLRRSADEPHEHWQRKQPLLFTYTDDGRHKSNSIRDINSRSKRSGHHRRPHRRKNNVETCRRQSLYVDFADVGWSDWIVAPPGYDAYYCHGKCPFPLAEHLNSTNHAVVQTLVNNLNPGKVPNACCVPTQLTGISMLYLNDQSTVVLKNYQDMTVVGCGCR